MLEHAKVSNDDQSKKQKPRALGHVPNTQDGETNAFAGYVPLPIGTSRANRASSAGGQAAALNRFTTPQSARTDYLVLRLQQQHGNYYVQQLLTRARTPEKKEEEAPGTNSLVLRGELPPRITPMLGATPAQRTITTRSVAPGVDPERIAEFRALVAQYQSLLRSGTLSEEEIAGVNQAITRAETAVRRAEQVAAAGSSLRAGAGVALGASAVLAADDLTGIGVADDVAIPFVLLAAGVLALGAMIASRSTTEIQRTGNAARDAIAQAIRAISQILLAQRVGDQVRGLGTQIAIHLARILGTTVSGQPPDHQGDPERDRPHWWAEVKNWIRQIRDKGLSPRQLLRELRRRFSDQQLTEIREAIREAARRMGEDPPDFPPTVMP